MCHILAPQADAKKRRACGKRKLVGRRRPNIIVALEQSMLVDIKSKAKARRAVTFLWLRRIASRHLVIWKERGGEQEAYGKPFHASATWTWKFLIRQGIASMRTDMPRRSPTPEDNMAHMVKWLHMMREVVLKPGGQPGPHSAHAEVAPQDGAAPVAQPVQKDAKRRKTDGRTERARALPVQDIGTTIELSIRNSRCYVRT